MLFHAPFIWQTRIGAPANPLPHWPIARSPARVSNQSALSSNRAGQRIAKQTSKSSKIQWCQRQKMGLSRTETRRLNLLPPSACVAGPRRRPLVPNLALTRDADDERERRGPLHKVFIDWLARGLGARIDNDAPRTRDRARANRSTVEASGAQTSCIKTSLSRIPEDAFKAV